MSQNIIIDIIPSKSFAHRAYICHALSKIKGEIICPLDSDDIKATRDCIITLNEGGSLMECGESGSTLRFLMPIMAALGRKGIFITKGKLKDRPLSPLREELQSHGCRISPEGESPIVIEGSLQPGEFTIKGDVSSQFVSGLLMALPLLKSDSTINIPGKLESSSYVDITTEVLTSFGISWVKKMNNYGSIFTVPGNQEYKSPDKYEVEGDWSNAAFWLCAGAIGERPVTVRGLNIRSIQGDRQIVEIIKAFGGEVIESFDWVSARPSELKGIDIDVSDIPDLAPVIALLGSVATGTTRITGAGRLRFKESDRLSTITKVLRNMGVRIRKNQNGLTVRGSLGKRLKGGILNSVGDHRIVMMAAIASLVCDEKLTILGKEAVNKSYPGFFEELESKGLAWNIQ